MEYPGARKLRKSQKKTPWGPGTQDTKLKLICSFLHVFIQLRSIENQLSHCLSIMSWGTYGGLVTVALNDLVG